MSKKKSKQAKNHPEVKKQSTASVKQEEKIERAVDDFVTKDESNEVKLLYDVNEKPSPLQWIVLSLQHVFAMFGATVLVPILVNQGIAAGVGSEFLSTAVALVTAGLGTLIYILCTRGKSPVFLGSSFAFITPVIMAYLAGSASGRATSSVESFANEIGAEKYLISGNGALVYDIQNSEIIYNKFLTKEQVLNIIEICEENSIFCNVYTENEVIAKSLNYNVLFYHAENAKKEEEKRTNINVVQNMYKYINDLSTENFLKVTVCDEDELIFNSIMKKLKTIENIDILDVSHMSRKIIRDGTEDVPIKYFYTEITNLNVNKWSAIEFLISKLNIKREEVIGIGDNINDKELIQNSGLGVAMGNSSPEIKKVAKIVTKDNNLDGVAHVLNEYVLDKM